jgi:hypothetical protein
MYEQLKDYVVWLEKTWPIGCKEGLDVTKALIAEIDNTQQIE